MRHDPDRFPFDETGEVGLGASTDEVFAHLDDHTSLSSHMSRPSWKTAGSRMSFELDEQRGQAVGSHIILRGSVLGLPIFVEEVVKEYLPPHRKVWETIGLPKLLVIGHYRMGLALTPAATGCRLSIFIDYALPTDLLGHWLGCAYGRYYARWCVRQTCNDARSRFPVAERHSDQS